MFLRSQISYLGFQPTTIGVPKKHKTIFLVEPPVEAPPGSAAAAVAATVISAAPQLPVAPADI